MVCQVHKHLQVTAVLLLLEVSFNFLCWKMSLSSLCATAQFFCTGISSKSKETHTSSSFVSETESSDILIFFSCNADVGAA